MDCSSFVAAKKALSVQFVKHKNARRDCSTVQALSTKFQTPSYADLQASNLLAISLTSLP